MLRRASCQPVRIPADRSVNGRTRDPRPTRRYFPPSQVRPYEVRRILPEQPTTSVAPVEVPIMRMYLKTIFGDPLPSVPRHQMVPPSKKMFPRLPKERSYSTKSKGEVIDTMGHLVSSVERTQSKLSQAGFSSFLQKVYGYTGLGLTASLAVAWVAPFLGFDPVTTILTGAVMSFAGIFGLSLIQPVHRETATKEGLVLTTENPSLRTLSYAAVTIGMGAAIGPAVAMFNVIDPMIVPISALITSSLFGGCLLFEKYLFKRGTDASSWQGPLTAGLVGLIGLQLAGLGASFFLGTNAFSSAVHSLDVGLGSLFFMVMAIADSAAARKMYQVERKADHALCALSLYLDAMNLLIRIMELVAKARK